MMTKKRLIATVIGMAALGSGCATHVIVDPAMPGPDALTRPALASYMRSAPSPTIVLRVPAPQAQLVQEQRQQGDAALNQLYNLIEKELVKANFAVRDRGLLDAIVRSGQNLDYPLILERTRAELILEILAIQTKDFSNSRYARADKKGDGTHPVSAFPIQGWQFDCKITLVSTGEIGGIYTINIAPWQNHFLIKGTTILNATPAGAPSGYEGYAVRLEDTAAPFVRTLLENLRSSAGAPGIRR